MESARFARWFLMLRQLVKSNLAHVLPEPLYWKVIGSVAIREIRSGKRDEKVEFELLSQSISAGDIVVDVGANYGLYTNKLSQLVGPSGKVHAFEPIPNNAGILKRLIATSRLTNVVLHECGVGETSREIELIVPVRGGVPIGGHAHAPSLSGENGREAGEVYRVQVVRLDDELSKTVSFIKIDIEGFELFALKGAERILKTCRPTVLCEIWEEFTARFGITAPDVINYMRSLGYSSRQVSNENHLFYW